MSDYIKREEAIDACLEETSTKWSTKEEAEEGRLIASVIESLPSADVVEVVRCKDCIHNDQCKHRVVMWVEDPINTWHKDIDFCSYGERKDNE